VVNKVEKDMAAAAARCVFIALKWLGFHHQLLQNSQTSPAIERVIEALGRLPPSSTKNHFEEYIISKLYSPYKQYLLKLAVILMEKARQDFSPTKGREPPNEPVYCMYNLISYSLQEFSLSIKEFSRFFHRFYPCLNDYIYLVGRDLSKFMKRIRLSY
jgi:hypothetical protein